MYDLPLLFPWSDSLSSVFLIWGKSPSSLVSVCSGNYLSEESGHRTQRPCFFSTEELCFLESVLNCVNKSLSDTVNRKREVFKNSMTSATRAADRRH